MSKWKTQPEAVAELVKRNNAVCERHGICNVLAIEPELIQGIGEQALLIEARRMGIQIIDRQTGKTYR